MIDLTHCYRDDLKVFLLKRATTERLNKRLIDAREAYLWLKPEKALPKYERVKVTKKSWGLLASILP